MRFCRKSHLAWALTIAISIHMVGLVEAQIVDQGISAAGNTSRSFQDASIARDSRLNAPLDLLNDFYPAIEIQVADHDNVRRRPDIQEQDIRWVVNPSLAYRTNLGRHQFYVAYNGTFVFHQDLDQEDSQANTLNANLGLDLTRRWDLELFAAIGESFEERGISGSRDFSDLVNFGEDSGPEDIDFTRFGADLVFGRKIGIVTGVVGFEHTETNFSNEDLIAGIDPQGRDRETDSLHLDVDWRFASNTSVFGRIEFTETDFQSSFSDLDSEQVNFLIGLRLKATARLSGVVGLGQSDRDFEVENREDFDSEIFYGNLAYAFNPFSRLNLAISRAIEEPGDVESDFFVSDLIGLSWQHSITPRIDFNIYGKIIEDDYNSGRIDEFTDWGLGLDYRWRDWLGLGIYYGEVERESTLQGIDFEDNFIGLRLRSDLRRFFGGRQRQSELEPGSFGRTLRSQAIRR